MFAHTVYLTESVCGGTLSTFVCAVPCVCSQTLRPAVSSLRSSVDKAVSQREQNIQKFCAHLDKDIEELGREVKDIKNQAQVSLSTLRTYVRYSMLVGCEVGGGGGCEMGGAHGVGMVHAYNMRELGEMQCERCSYC